MSKESFYFSHDYNSRSDPKLIKLSMKLGMDGIGIYWCVIEMLYEQNGYIDLSNLESIAFELHSECDRIKTVLQNFDLFKFKGELFYSESVLRRLKKRNKISSGAKLSALKRWHPDKYNDAVAMPTHSEGNAIKERKGKEIKEKKEEEEPPPSFEDFKTYALENNADIDLLALELKYKSWVENKWRDGNNKKILNWKSKLLNTIPYIKNKNDGLNRQHSGRHEKNVNAMWPETN